MASIRERAGRWQARVTRRGFAPEVKTFTSKENASRWARSIEADMDQGGFASRSEAERTTLADVIRRYVKEVSPTKRGGRDEAIRLKAMMRTRLAKLTMAALSAKAVAQYRDDRLRTVVPATVVRDLAMLSSLINHSRREWSIAITNPVALIRKPNPGSGRTRVLEAAEEGRLLDSLQPEGRRSHWIAPLVIVALETAMRRGELLALRWEHVNLRRRVVFLPMTKNGRPRYVPLSPRAAAFLDSVPRSIDGRVFPLTAMALDAAFRKACRRAALLDLRFHDLRHTATTRLASTLPNVIELMAVTGHSSPRMLARYYHVRAEDLAKKLESAAVGQTTPSA